MESANARALSSPQTSASKSGTQSTAIDARTSLASTKFTTRKSMERASFPFAFALSLDDTTTRVHRAR
ncbi:hypothetical protein [uncultured Selenomonas sp.]|uniref:hypothetical protein n=1 Tax=uncultured Selenomonas sp. TaxID=159275 RepID=UPI0025FA9522|nr:hypothetical protein [uncultured Selenomonas sp.]